MTDKTVKVKNTTKKCKPCEKNKKRHFKETGTHVHVETVSFLDETEQIQTLLEETDMEQDDPLLEKLIKDGIEREQQSQPPPEGYDYGGDCINCSG